MRGASSIRLGERVTAGYSGKMPRSVHNPPRRLGGLDVEWFEAQPAKLHVSEDHPAQILTANRSRDLPFSWSLNPYRGCSHACAYCYARAYHEFVDGGAGSDFERRISVKVRAPALLEEAFERRGWRGEPVCFSGVTDCYQPIERRYEVTRGCLEVCARYRNPVAIITRSPLIERDLDHLAALAAHGAIRVTMSIPILDAELARALEPGAPPPAARLRAVAALATAGIPVGVGLAPVFPGLNDASLPQVLKAARAAGAAWSWTGPGRLPEGVHAIFEERLRAARPHRADAVLARLRRIRGGGLDERSPGARFKGEGRAWQATVALYRIWKKKLGFTDPPPWPDPSPFRRPARRPPGRQLSLF